MHRWSPWKTACGSNVLLPRPRPAPPFTVSLRPSVASRPAFDPMNIVHIASTIHGGAGTGMLRYREAMLSVGLKSRVVVAWDSPSGEPCVAVSPRKSLSPLCRVARRVCVELDPSSRMLKVIKHLDSAAGRQPSNELFSPRSEEH